MKLEIQNTKGLAKWVLGIRSSDFFRISSFDIRLFYSRQPRQPLSNLADFQHPKSVRIVPHRTRIKRRRLALADNNQQRQRHTEGLEFFDKSAALIVPGQQHADTAADRRDVVEHQVFQRAERM